MNPCPAAAARADTDETRRQGGPEARAHLRRIFFGSAPASDVNLFLLDARRTSLTKAVLGLLDLDHRALRRPLRDADIEFLILQERAATYATAHAAQDKAISASIEHLAIDGADLISSCNDVQAAYPGEPGPSERRRMERAALRGLVPFVRLIDHATGQIWSERHQHFEHYLSAYLAGLERYRLLGNLEREHSLSLMALYCVTGGLASEVGRALLSIATRPYDLPSPHGVLGDLAQEDVEAFVERIRTDGYCAFETTLDATQVAALTEFSLEAPCVAFDDRNGWTPVSNDKPYPRDNPDCAKYVVSQKVALAHPLVRQLMIDPSILAVTQAFLNAPPACTLTAIWWNAVLHERPSDVAAQLYHFDLHQLSFLKWFIYLTDVTTEGGPHCVVQGSHKPGAKPAHLISRGFDRFTDDEIIGHYGQTRCKELRGKRGTIIAVDTRAYHKGKRPARNDRLIFELSFASGGPFGAAIEQVPVRGGDDSLKRMANRYPGLYPLLRFEETEAGS